MDDFFGDFDSDSDAPDQNNMMKEDSVVQEPISIRNLLESEIPNLETLEITSIGG